MSTKSYHISVDIRGALQRKKLAGLLVDDDGREMSDREVRDFLIDELRKGHDAFCGCDNRASDGRCAGHIKEVLS